MTKKMLYRIISLIIICLILLLMIFHFNIFSLVDEVWMDNHVRNQGFKGVFIYVMIITLLISMGVPRQMCSILGGYVFGMWLGTLLATIGTSLACIICFCYARFLGQNYIHAKFGYKLEKFNSFLCQSPFLLSLIVRIVPLGSNFLTNFLAGISSIPALLFLSGSGIGFTVQNFIFASMGSGLQMHGNSKLLISIVLYIISLSLGYWVYWRYKQHNKCNQ